MSDAYQTFKLAKGTEKAPMMPSLHTQLHSITEGAMTVMASHHILCLAILIWSCEPLHGTNFPSAVDADNANQFKNHHDTGGSNMPPTSFWPLRQIQKKKKTETSFFCNLIVSQRIDCVYTKCPSHVKKSTSIIIISNTIIQKTTTTKKNTFSPHLLKYTYWHQCKW